MLRSTITNYYATSDGVLRHGMICAVYFVHLQCTLVDSTISVIHQSPAVLSEYVYFLHINSSYSYSYNNY